MNMDKNVVANEGAALRQEYSEFLNKAATALPKVDQKLLLNILQFQNFYSDWEGNVILKVVYPAGVDIEKKKEWIYARYSRIPSIEENKTLRFKTFKMYTEELADLVSSDQDIEFVTGSVTLTPGESYAA
jgi:hypothetical protein